MPEITDRESLEVWLKDKPREFSVAIATRAALRVAPLLVTALTRHANMVLPTFRAMGVASFAGRWPTGATEIGAAYARHAYAAAYAVDAAALDSRADASVIYAARAAAYAAYATLAAVDNAADAAYAADAASAAYYAADAAAYATDEYAADTAAHTALWNSIAQDADFLETGLTEDADPADLAADLWLRPLWHGPEPEWAHEAWTHLKGRLLSASEGWEAWTDWYQDHLYGRPGSAALELARATIADEDWKKGPAYVNAIIAAQIEEHVRKRTPPVR